VLDVNLPDISGLEVLEALRRSWPAIPVILSTGHADATALDSIRKLRVPFLLKPYEIGDLLALLARIEIR
jgi:putative two-component system response regulator